MGEGSGGFEWWVPHDRALRRARVLLAIGALVVASYVVVPLLCLVVLVRGGVGSLSSRDVTLIVVGSVVVLVVVASLIALAASHAPVRRIRVWSGARPASDAEMQLLAPTLGTFVIARGMAMPAIWVTDDVTPNAFAFGHAGSPNVCMTHGALELPPHELAALCALELTALTCAPYTACVAAIDLVLFAEWCARVLWLTPVPLFLSTVVGVPSEVAAVVAFCFAGFLAMTRLVLFVADRLLPRLLDDAAELVDLEAVRLTERPADMANLLTRVADSSNRVTTAWQVAHRWLDRRERERGGQFGTGLMDPPVLARHCEHGNESMLRARATVLAHQAGTAVTSPPLRRRRGRRRASSRGA